MTDPRQPIRTPALQRLDDFRRRLLPVLVWGLCAALCGVLVFRREMRFEHIGLAQAVEYEVSAAATGTLRHVLVEPFDSVEANEIVARLDETALAASLETARATVRQLTAELDAARVQARSEAANLTAELRRFQIDEEQRRLDVLALRVQIESDQLEEERLALEVRRQGPLLRDGFVDQSTYDNVRLQYETVRKRIERNVALLDQTQQELEVAAARRSRYESELPGEGAQLATLEPLREAIAVANARMDELEIARHAMSLRAPVTGQVTQVLCRPGQAVVPGEPIVTIVERAAQEIVAYVTEADPVVVHGGTRVLVASNRDPGRTAESVVLRDSASVQPLPQRLWRNPQVPDYGRPVVIAGVPSLELNPGELVRVRFLGE